jgi:glutathione peroxidase
MKKMKIRKILSSLTSVMLIISSSINARMSDNVGEKLDNVNDIVVKDMNGKDVKLSEYNGKILLIVNVASECGFTKQYAGLQKVYEKYKDKGFEILAFPCNDFGGQEPGTIEQIKNFCTTKFNVSFKIFDKLKILGKEKSSLYQRLTDNTVTKSGEVKWNFEKFVISKKGKIIARFSSTVPPESNEIISAIETEINK